jgi:hypothetical protein
METKTQTTPHVPESHKKCPRAFLKSLGAFLKSPKAFIKRLEAFLKSLRAFLKRLEAFLKSPGSFLKRLEAFFMGLGAFFFFQRGKNPATALRITFHSLNINFKN